VEFGNQLDRSEVEDREIDRYPDQRVTDITSDYLETVKNYIPDNEDSELLKRALNFEIDRRKRKDLRINEVPSTEDLFKIKKYANEVMLYERKGRRRMSEEKRESLNPLHEMDEAILQRHTSDEIGIRRSQQFKEYLDTDYSDNRLAVKVPSQEKVEGNIGLYMMVSDSDVKGIKYRTDGMMAPDAAWQLDSLTREAAETQRKLEEEPDRICGFGDTTFFSLTKLHADFLEAVGKDIDKSEMIGYEIEDLDEHMNHLMDESSEALRTLEKIGVTYFEIEGFHTEEVASLVDHLTVRDGFEVERTSTHTDTDMNSEEWREYHEKRIREDTDENNALRLFLDDEDN
jgi:hypothetical protein